MGRTKRQPRPLAANKGQHFGTRENPSLIPERGDCPPLAGVAMVSIASAVKAEQQHKPVVHMPPILIKSKIRASMARKVFPGTGVRCTRRSHCTSQNKEKTGRHGRNRSSRHEAHHRLFFLRDNRTLRASHSLRHASNRQSSTSGNELSKKCHGIPPKEATAVQAELVHYIRMASPIASSMSAVPRKRATRKCRLSEHHDTPQPVSSRPQRRLPSSSRSPL